MPAGEKKVRNFTSHILDLGVLSLTRGVAGLGPTVDLTSLELRTIL